MDFISTRKVHGIICWDLIADGPFKKYISWWIVNFYKERLQILSLSAEENFDSNVHNFKQWRKHFKTHSSEKFWRKVLRFAVKTNCQRVLATPASQNEKINFSVMIQ